MQIEAPGEGGNMPAAQTAQLEAPKDEEVPAAQLVHVAFEVAPIADETVPAGHAVQLEAPAEE